MFGILAVVIGFAIAYGAGENQYRIIKPPEYVVRVDGQLRTLKVWYDKEGLQHLEFFKEDANHIIFLGEEIFDQDDNKIYDSYIENNGEWPQGYNRRWR